MKPILRIILILMIMATAAAAGEAKEKLFYILNYSVYHCNAEIELNGILVTRSDRETAYSLTGFADIGMWIYPGTNTVTVTIKPMAGRKAAITNSSVELSVSTAKEGQMSDEGKKIMSLRIPEKDSDTSLDAVTSPVVKTATFKPAYIPPSELWGKVKPVVLDAAARAAITKLVKDYHAAFVRKDADALHSFLIFAATDVSRTRHQAEDEVKTKMKDALKEMMAEKGFVMEPLDVKNLVMKPVAEGRVIQVTDRNGEAPVRTKGTKESGSYSFPVYAGLVDGKWIIVR
ncbi:MAG: hypothetical protein JW807_05125 [Spirochaetes bacterium]|nr:hypothetical protein [Spirochaetota bacterium]